VLVGASGRMGQAIERAAATAGDVRIVARIGRTTRERPTDSGPNPKGSGYGTRADGAEGGALGSLVRAGEVVVDFSAPEGLRAAARTCRERHVPLVTGTTGLDADDERLLEEVARVAPVVRSANFSLGVLALRRALETALAIVPDTWDVEIIERHHRGKADSPSGTALAIARDAARVRGGRATFTHGREGRLGPRRPEEIGVHAVRGGTWVGDHAVLLAGTGESLELRHVAEDRAAFAHGALAAARFVATAPPGRYELDDVTQSMAPRA